MTRWHIVDDCHLHRLARLRRLQGLLLVVLGVAAGLALGRDEGPVAAAQAATVAAPATVAMSTSRDWCDGSDSKLRMSCALSR